MIFTIMKCNQRRPIVTCVTVSFGFCDFCYTTNCNFCCIIFASACLGLNCRIRAKGVRFCIGLLMAISPYVKTTSNQPWLVYTVTLHSTIAVDYIHINLCSLHKCTMYIIYCALYNVHSILYFVQYTLCTSLRLYMYIVHYTWFLDLLVLNIWKE